MISLFFVVFTRTLLQADFRILNSQGPVFIYDTASFNVAHICKELEVETKEFYEWLSVYGDVARLFMSLDKENKRLKKMYINLSIQNDTLHETLIDVLKNDHSGFNEEEK